MTAAACPLSIPRQDVRRRSVTVTLLCSVALLNACSTLTPQIFAESLYTQQPLGAVSPASTTASGVQASARSGTVTVSRALAEAENVQRQYVSAVKDLSEVGTGSSAALLALGTLGLLKAVSNPNSKDLLALGILGSATYAYGTTMTSKPRQLLFLSGAEALTCAITATRPYDLPDNWLRPSASTQGAVSTAACTKPSADGASAALTDLSLLGRTQQAECARLALDRAMDGLRPFAHDLRILVTVGRPAPPRCSNARFPSCPPQPASASADQLKLGRICEQRVAVQRDECAGTSERDRTETAHPDVRLAMARIDKMRRHLSAMAGTARAQIAVAEGAGNALWDRTVTLQLKVAAEVLKTEPDLSAVLATTQGLKAGAFALTGAPALGPAQAASAPSAAAFSGAANAKAESDRSAGKRRNEPWVVPQNRPNIQLDAADKALDDAASASSQLYEPLAELRERVRAAGTKLTRCSSTLPQAQLSLSPDIETLDLAAGASATFYVSGGTGVPRGSVAPVGQTQTGKLERALDEQGRFRFVYTAPAKPTAGGHDVLSFTDGAGALHRDVSITASAAAGDTGTATAESIDYKSIPLTTLAAQVGLDAKSPNPQEVLLAIETCQKTQLKQPNPDPHRLDAATMAALLGGQCRAPIR